MKVTNRVMGGRGQFKIGGRGQEVIRELRMEEWDTASGLRTGPKSFQADQEVDVNSGSKKELGGS